MQPKVTKVWVDDTAVHIQTEDGKIFSEKWADYRRLRNATPKQRANFEYNTFGIHWEDIDEDLCFQGFLNKNQEQQKNDIYSVFGDTPEVNVSGIA